MASTGIILRRNSDKNYFVGDNALIEGELVVETTTNSFGYIDEGDTLVWGKIENELPDAGGLGQILSKKSAVDYDVEWTNAPSTKSVVQGQVYSELYSEYAVKIPWDFSVQKILAGEFRFPLTNDPAFDGRGEIGYGISFNLAITTDFKEYDPKDGEDYVTISIPVVVNGSSVIGSNADNYPRQMEISIVKIDDYLYLMLDGVYYDNGNYFAQPFELYYSIDDSTFTNNVWGDYYETNGFQGPT